MPEMRRATANPVFVDAPAGAPAKPGPYRAARICLAGRGCFAFKRAQRKPVRDPVAGRGPGGDGPRSGARRDLAGPETGDAGIKPALAMYAGALAVPLNRSPLPSVGAIEKAPPPLLGGGAKSREDNAQGGHHFDARFVPSPEKSIERERASGPGWQMGASQARFCGHSICSLRAL